MVPFWPFCYSAINLITDVDYQNNLNVNGYNFLNNSVDGNYTMVTDNG